MINILQVGMGPLGVNIAKYISEKETMQTIAAIDISPNLKGKTLGNLDTTLNNNITICSSASECQNIDDVDVILLTTSSSLESIYNQVVNLLPIGKPIVSTCEELTYPWIRDNDLSKSLDAKAKEAGVAIVSTGVNPGFLMDTLPSMLTGVCKDVDYIQVNRIQDARTRRVPFQKKIGAGLDLDAFDAKKAAGTLRHVGLAESMQFIAGKLDWTLDSVEDIISPVIASEDITTEHMNIPRGYAMGVRQVGKAVVNGKEKIKLVFEATVGGGSSYDEVQIKGNPNINSKIDGGVHGDIATCSIVLNAIPVLMKTSPGLKTMGDLPIVTHTR